MAVAGGPAVGTTGYPVCLFRAVGRPRRCLRPRIPLLSVGRRPTRYVGLLVLGGCPPLTRIGLIDVRPTPGSHWRRVRITAEPTAGSLIAREPLPGQRHPLVGGIGEPGGLLGTPVPCPTHRLPAVVVVPAGVPAVVGRAFRRAVVVPSPGLPAAVEVALGHAGAPSRGPILVVRRAGENPVKASRGSLTAMSPRRNTR